ncbi:TPA_asm: hypothetical protein vir335_00046 [Classicovirus victor]|uniref:Uncharacterized protein n=1 Tax=Caudoviricetes sp. vir335 TaxID=3068357 RepID=A0AA87CHZ7_9CAUD|nr:TPA_asm: hypothetical protein vir335_00046 [Caudoviricetes sp. vir335]
MWKKSRENPKDITIGVHLDRADPAVKTYSLGFEIGRKQVEVMFTEHAFKELVEKMGEALNEASRIYRGAFQTIYPL